MEHATPKKTLLILDDDRTLCKTLGEALASPGLEVLSAQTAREGLDICSSRKVDLVLLDEKLPDAEGHTLCPSILSSDDQTKIIFITAYPSFEHAVNAVKLGAFDYLSKPFEFEEVRLAVDKALKTLELERAGVVQSYRLQKEREATVLVGETPALENIRWLIGMAAGADSAVLITGETGTGKNVAARLIHFLSPHREAPFLSLNCTALPENLIEAELFGHEKGAFTGAVSLHKGVFEIAEGGTLFLDEIGSMPLHLQSKLLGVLDDGCVKRLGGRFPIPVKVRIIASTNADLESMIQARTFREDLFYRLNVLRIHLPPLRERRDDIPGLCRHFLDRFSRGRRLELHPDEVSRLRAYEWPGNIRELRNILERSVLLHGPNLRPSELLVQRGTAEVERAALPGAGEPAIRSLEEVARDHIKSVFRACGGNTARTARALHVSLSTLKRKIKEYGLKGTVQDGPD